MSRTDTSSDTSPDTVGAPVELPPVSASGDKPAAGKKKPNKPSTPKIPTPEEIMATMAECDGDVEDAAQSLGLPPEQLEAILSAMGFEFGEDEDDEGDEDYDEEEAERQLAELLHAFSGVQTAVAEHSEALDSVVKRVESMDRTLFSALRGMVILLSDVEVLVNPVKEPEDKAKALQRLQNTLAAMRTTL